MLLFFTTQTCNFSDCAKHFQLLGIQRWDIFKTISEKKPTKKKTQYDPTDWLSWHRNICWDCWDCADNYPRIPVTRKCRLPWILVQLMKLSMLLASTVCLFSAPVPLHTTWGDRTPSWQQLMTDRSSALRKVCLGFNQCEPFGQSPLQSSHWRWPSLTTSVLSWGQALTQELPSTTKWAARSKKGGSLHFGEEQFKYKYSRITCIVGKKYVTEE